MFVNDCNGTEGKSFSIVAKLGGRKLFSFWESCFFKVDFLGTMLHPLPILLSDAWLFSYNPVNFERHSSTISRLTETVLLSWTEDPCLLWVKLLIDGFLVSAKELYFLCLSCSLSDYISCFNTFFSF